MQENTVFFVQPLTRAGFEVLESPASLKVPLKVLGFESFAYRASYPVTHSFPFDDTQEFLKCVGIPVSNDNVVSDDLENCFK